MEKKTRVILIDDDDDTLEIFAEFLDLKGIDVLAIGKNGKEAFELFKAHRPDVVMLDVMMPEYDGFYGLGTIKKIDPDAKVIMMTADLTEPTYKKLESLQASAILYKPYDIDQVIQSILDITSGKLHPSLVLNR